MKDIIYFNTDDNQLLTKLIGKLISLNIEDSNNTYHQIFFGKLKKDSFYYVVNNNGQIKEFNPNFTIGLQIQFNENITEGFEVRNYEQDIVYILSKDLKLYNISKNTTEF